MKKWLSFFPLFAAIAALTWPSYAQENNSSTAQKVVLDGKEYEHEQLSWDFLNVSINRSLWLDDTNHPSKIFQIFSKNKEVSDSGLRAEKGISAPAISEYRLRQDGLPTPFVVNKWVTRPL